MSYACIDDRVHHHPKVMEAVDLAGNEAIGVWVRCLSYCADALTDGRIPRGFLTEVCGSPESAQRIADALSRSGLFDAGEYHGEPCWYVHDYLDWNPSANEVKSKRKADIERKQKGRTRRAESSQHPDGFRVDSDQNPAPPTPTPTPIEKPQSGPQADPDTRTGPVVGEVVEGGVRAAAAAQVGFALTSPQAVVAQATVAVAVTAAAQIRRPSVKPAPPNPALGKPDDKAQQQLVDRHCEDARRVFAAMNAARQRVRPRATGIAENYPNLVGIASALERGHTVEECLCVIAERERRCQDPRDAKGWEYFNHITPWREENFAAYLASWDGGGRDGMSAAFQAAFGGEET